MKSYIAALAALVLLVSCKEESINSFSINGNVDGLRVGSVMLQKLQDSALITLDSVALDGKSNFTLTTDLAEPQMLYLYLDVKDGSQYDDRLSFFAADTTMSITTSLKDFESDAVITGSKNNEILDTFNGNLKKLNQTYTDLMKRSMNLSGQENPNQSEVDALNEDYEKYLRKRVLYAINFAGFNKDHEVAPYMLLQEAFDANPKLLDSIYNIMPKKIQTSLYGKDLSEMIKELKSY